MQITIPLSILKPKRVLSLTASMPFAWIRNQIFRHLYSPPIALKIDAFVRFSIQVIMHFLLQLTGADPSNPLGRLDYASLSQQTLMELLFQSIAENKMQIADTIADATMMDCVSLNDADEIIKISWPNQGLYGKLPLEWVPQTVQKVHLHANRLHGPLDLDHLPDALEELLLNRNAFSGEISLKSLPPKMTILSLGSNSLEGTLDLEHLPQSMWRIYLSHNAFSGEICLTKLPPHLGYLYLTENTLSGSLDLTRLPDSLEILYLDDNGFEGKTDLSDISKNISLVLDNNPLLEGTASRQTFGEDKFSAKGTKIIILD